MQQKGIYHNLKDYVRASGDLAVKLYKEDIEAALRTENFGGFELLSLTDYTGQSTATVGILDAMFESKGLITPKEWRRFCNNVVPLFKAKRIFKNTEILEAELDLYDFGEHKIENPIFDIRISNKNETLFSLRTNERNIQFPLDCIKSSSILEVNMNVDGFENSWRIFVFVDENVDDVQIIKTETALKEIIINGGRAIVGKELFKNSINGSFIPVFWSPVHFPSQKPCGAIIDEAHPIFKYFPTEKYPDYQWKRLLDSSVGIDISKYAIEPIIEAVPNFMDNTPSSPLFEAKLENAELLFAGFDLDDKSIEVTAFKNALIKYVASENFAPQYEIKNYFDTSSI